MQRPAAVLVALGTLLLASGCGSSGPAPPPAVAAPPQAMELAWNERTPETGPGLVFRVHRFAVTEDGWEADVEVENRSEIPWILGEDPFQKAGSAIEIATPAQLGVSCGVGIIHGGMVPLRGKR